MAVKNRNTRMTDTGRKSQARLIDDKDLKEKQLREGSASNSNFNISTILAPYVYDDGNPDQDVEGLPQAGGWSAATFPYSIPKSDTDDGNPDQDLEGLPQMGGWSAATFPYTAPESKGNKGNAPTIDFSSSPYWLSEMSAIYGDLGNDKFKFDLNGEELYQQYRDQYLRNGRLAMMDTMGQAAGLTGGYGSSYAQQVGQQTYQGYVNDLNAIVPNVYSAAYQRWRDEQGDKLDRYKLASDMYSTTYGAELDEKKLAASQAQAELEAETERQKLAYDAAESERKYGLDAAKLELDKIKSGLYSVTPDGRTVPKGSPADLTSVVETRLRNMLAYDTWEAYSRMYGDNDSTIAHALAYEIAQDSGYSNEEQAQLYNIILGILTKKDGEQ